MAYLREATFSDYIEDTVFMGEVQLDSILGNFFLLVLPKSRVVEVKKGGLRAIGEYQQVPVALQGEPLHVDVLEVAVPQVVSFLNVLNFMTGTLK